MRFICHQTNRAASRTVCRLHSRWRLKRSTTFSKRRLTLAWKRLTTASNQAYKRYFRSAFLAYDLGLEGNIAALHARLQGGWTPSRPDLIHMAKPSGLQRTISLLALEDQIVYQAIAQGFEERLRRRRQAVQDTTVFSNRTGAPRSEFFLQPWRDGYERAHGQLLTHWSAGLHWVASFDLTAFYDTISHEKLVGLVRGRDGDDELLDVIQSWLGEWSMGAEWPPLRHGIPQGPIASDFLAECFLLPIDEALSRRGVQFVRYGDDIHILATSASAAHQGVVILEILTKDKGLIAQGGKRAIRKLNSKDEVEELVRTFSNREQGQAFLKQPQKDGPRIAREYWEEKFLMEATEGRPRRVKDKSEFRHVLFNAPRSARIQGPLLGMLERNPEFVDEITFYLSKWRKSKVTVRSVSQILLNGSAYDYHEYRIWLLAESLATKSDLNALKSQALRRLRETPPKSPVRWGAMSFLLRCEREGLCSVSWRLAAQDPLCRLAVLSEHAPLIIGKRQLTHRLLQQDGLASLSLAEAVALAGKSHLDFGLRSSQLPASTQRALKAWGLIGHVRAARYEPISEMLWETYETTRVKGWKQLLRDEYPQAIALLRGANASYLMDRSKWLRLQNSFNEILVRRLVERLHQKGLPGGRPIVDKHGTLLSLGVLAKSHAFAAHRPNIAGPISRANERRNSLPDSHSKDYKTGKPTTFLRTGERNLLYQNLVPAYEEIATLLASKVLT